MLNDWLLVETLDPGVETAVVAEGVQVREWLSLSHRRGPLSPAVARAVTDVIGRCLADPGVEVCEVISGSRVIAAPVMCAFGAVHGVQLWVGPPDAEPPPRRRVAAWDWKSDTAVAYHGPGVEELVFGRAASDVRVERMPPEVFGRIVRFDGRLEYMAAIAGTDPTRRWQGEAHFRGDDEVVRTIQMIVRVHREPQRVTRALVYELTDVRPASAPDTELAMSRAAARATEAGVGFVELDAAAVYEWTNDPPGPLRLWATERPELPAEDLSRLRSACSALLAGPSDGRCELAFRVRFPGTDWIAVRADLTRLGGDLAHGMIRLWPESTA